MYNIIIIDKCIGCGICSTKCPIQSIYGIANNILNVIDGECIGCNICISVCPIKCINFNSVKVNIKLNKFVIRQKFFVKNIVFSNNLINRLHFGFNNSLYMHSTSFSYPKNLF